MREEQEKKLADKGWQSMQQVLDREMPAERKRRPFVWWWTGLLLLPLAIWGGQAIWRSGTTPSVAPLPAHELMPKNERPVVQTTDNQPHTPLPASPSSGDANQQVSGKSAENQPQNAAALSAAYAPATIGEDKTRCNLPAIVIPDNPAEGIGNDARETAVPSSVQATDAAIAAAETTTDVASAAENPIDVLSPLTQMPPPVTLERAATQAPPPVSIIPVENNIVKAPGAKKWSFGITAAASTEQFSSLNGLSAGLSADFRFARKWGLRASGMYTRYRTSSNNQPVVAVESVDYANATGLYTGNNNYQPGTSSGGGNFSSEDLALNYVYVPLRKLHQIDMPLMLWWQPVSRLRLYSGFALNYTFLGQTTEQNYINNQAISLTSDSSQKRASRVATSELPRWQFHYQGGLGIQLGRHAELGAFWRMPLENIAFRTKADALENSSAGINDPLNVINNTNSTNPGRFVLQATWMF